MAALTKAQVNLVQRESEKPETLRPVAQSTLVKRIFSASLMVPIVVACIYLGGAWFAALVAFACIIMLFEWSRMVERQAFTNGFYTLALFACVVMYFAAGGNYLTAIGVSIVGGLIAGVIVKRSGGAGVWIASAAIYVLAPCIALLWLRLDAPDGRALSMLLFCVVWAADTGAFIFGKFIGGPKISHALSPSKTWAGIGGGILGGCLAGVTAAMLFIDPSAALIYLPIGGALGAASVLGDLVESGFKRNFGLKDISGLIPGHGGALDRLDGMIFATSAMTGGLLLYMLAEKVQG